MVRANDQPHSFSDSEYETFQKAAEAQERLVEELIREALASSHERIERTPLRDLPVLPDHRPLADLPHRADLYDEVLSDPAARKRREILDWIGRVDYYDDYEPTRLRGRKPR